MNAKQLPDLMAHSRIRYLPEILSVLAGMLLTLAFAPFDFSSLTLLILVGVLYSWHECSPARAALRAYVFGLGLFGSGISWVFVSIYYYGGAPWIGSLLLTGLVVCFWALFPALTAFIAVKMTARFKSLRVVIFPLVWIGVEYYRGYGFLNGFPWFQVAYTQLQAPLAGFIPLLGSYGTGFLLVLSAAVIVEAMHKTIRFKSVGLFLFVVWGSGGFLQLLHWTESSGDELDVALIQGNVPQDKKWHPDYRLKTLQDYQRLTEKNWDADLIIWPETSIPAYLHQVEEFYLRPLAEQAKQHQTDLVVSLPVIDADNNYFNSVVKLGEQPGRYDKNHLLPFGEYLPLQPLSGAVLSALNIHLGDFTSGGSRQIPLKAKGYSFATTICYEDAFASAILPYLPEAAFLVNVTNDAWFGDSLEPHQHMQMARMRAIETGRYLLRVTNTGLTGIVNPRGVLKQQAPMFEQTVLRGRIKIMRGLTPFARLGDGWVMLLVTVSSFLYAVWHWRRHSMTQPTSV